MQYRITYTHSSGSLTCNIPDGWKDSVLGFERHKTHYSLVKYFKSSFVAFGKVIDANGGRDFCIDIEENFGPSAKVDVLIERNADEYNVNWETLFQGTLPIILLTEVYDVTNLQHNAQLTFAELGDWVKLMASYETPVDLRSATDLDGNAVTPITVHTLPLPSQAIRKSYRGRNKNNYRYYIDVSGGVHTSHGPYGVIDFDDESTDEVTQKFQYGLMPNFFTDQQISIQPFEKFFFDYAGTGRLKLCINLSEFHRTGVNDLDFDDVNSSIDVFIKVGNSNPVTLARTTHSFSSSPVHANLGVSRDLGSFNITNNQYSRFLFEDTVTFSKGDKITFFIYKNTGGSINLHLWGSDGDGYLSLTPYNNDPFSGYWDPTAGLFPSVSVFGNRDLYKITRDGFLGGVAVYKDWYIFCPNLPAVANPQDPANWYIGEKSPTEGLFAVPDANSYFELDLDTVTPASSAPASTIHDTGKAIVERLIGSGKFISNYLGAPFTEGSYSEVGDASEYVLLKVLQLRGYSLADKPNSMSLKDYVESCYGIFNIGMGMTPEGLVEIEKREDFYSDEMSIELLYVAHIKKYHDQEYVYNQVELEYTNRSDEESEGLQDAQTKRSWKNLFTNIGKKLSVTTKWIAASVLIERARRTSIKQSADYKFDNNVAIINIVESGGDFSPRIEEDFDSVTNLLNEGTKYNKILTCARNFLRHLNFVSCGLKFDMPTNFTFADGEGNNDMQSEVVDNGRADAFGGNNLAEKGPIPAIDSPIIAMLYEIEHYITFEEFKTVDANRKKAIGVSQTGDGAVPFKIEKFEWNEYTGKLTMLARPKNYFRIVQPEDIDTEHEITDGVFTPEFEPPFS